MKFCRILDLQGTRRQESLQEVLSETVVLRAYWLNSDRYRVSPYWECRTFRKKWEYADFFTWIAQSLMLQRDYQSSSRTTLPRFHWHIQISCFDLRVSTWNRMRFVANHTPEAVLTTLNLSSGRAGGHPVWGGLGTGPSPVFFRGYSDLDQIEGRGPDDQSPVANSDVLASFWCFFRPRRKNTHCGGIVWRSVDLGLSC